MNTKFTPEFIAEQRELLDEFFPREELEGEIWTGYASALDEIERLQKELAKRDEIIKKYVNVCKQVLDERNKELDEKEYWRIFQFRGGSQ